MVLFSSYVSADFQGSSCLRSVKESFPVEVVSRFLITFSQSIKNSSVTLSKRVLRLTWNPAVMLHNIDLLSFDEGRYKDAIIYLVLQSGYSFLRSSWSSHILFSFSPIFCSGHHLRTTLTHLGQPFALDCNEWSLRLGEKLSYLSKRRWGVCYYYYWLLISPFKKSQRLGVAAFLELIGRNRQLSSLFSEVARLHANTGTLRLSPRTHTSRRCMRSALSSGGACWCLNVSWKSRDRF